MAGEVPEAALFGFWIAVIDHGETEPDDFIFAEHGFDGAAGVLRVRRSRRVM